MSLVYWRHDDGDSNIDVLDTDATEAHVGEVNAVPFSVVVAAHHGTETGWIVWHASDDGCCDHQAGWDAGRVPEVWDSSGLGAIDIASHVQCPGCGLLLSPPFATIVADQADIEAVANEITSRYQASEDRAIAAVVAQLNTEIADAIAARDAGDQDWETSTDTWGVNTSDNDTIVAWALHPDRAGYQIVVHRDTSGDTEITVEYYL